MDPVKCNFDHANWQILNELQTNEAPEFDGGESKKIPVDLNQNPLTFSNFEEDDFKIDGLGKNPNLKKLSDISDFFLNPTAQKTAYLLTILSISALAASFFIAHALVAAPLALPIYLLIGSAIFLFPLAPVVLNIGINQLLLNPLKKKREEFLIQHEAPLKAEKAILEDMEDRIHKTEEMATILEKIIMQVIHEFSIKPGPSNQIVDQEERNKIKHKIYMKIFDPFESHHYAAKALIEVFEFTYREFEAANFKISSLSKILWMGNEAKNKFYEAILSSSNFHEEYDKAQTVISEE